MAPALVRDIVALIARIGVGVVFVAHGWRKLVTDGLAETAAGFGQSEVPLPTLSAWFVALAELLGGIALIVGLVVPIAGALLTVIMIGAYVFVHSGKGIFIDAGGAELVIALGTASLLLAATGAGRFSLDHLLAPTAARRSRHLERHR
ncbi:DoxX family protein [Thermopolyspora sp. NPDC052614]|uniref:DoxX family protein n=1 Tax=Thermopolyspora sp. NPDC052614 TaxID=3155682 RepID=UPI00343D642B